MVRGLGPGLSVFAAGASRCGVRQGTAVAALVRAVHPRQRPDPGLRMGVFRPQSAGTRLGGLARLPHGPRPAGRRRSAVPGEVLSQAADELRVVGQPHGHGGIQRLRGRLPRTGQHHGGGPQSEAAAGHDAEAVGRNGLDGPVLPEPDADRLGTGPGERGLPGPGDEVLRAFRPYRIGDAAHGPARRGVVERDRRLLLRRTVQAGQHLPQVPRPFAGGADPALLDGLADGGGAGAAPRLPGERRLVLAQPAAPDGVVRPPGGARRQKILCAIADEGGAAAAAVGTAVGPGRVSRPARPTEPVEAARGGTVPLRRGRGALRGGGVVVEDQGRQLELARPGMVPDVVSADRVAADAGRGLRPVAAGGRGDVRRHGPAVRGRPDLAVCSGRKRPPAGA